MTTYKFGDVVLVPFPFTNQTTHKKRPAILINTDAYHQSRPDLILMPITSQVRKPLGFGEVEIVEWHQAGLLKASVIKPLLATIDQSLIVKRLGALTPSDWQVLEKSLPLILQLAKQ